MPESLKILNMVFILVKLQTAMIGIYLLFKYNRDLLVQYNTPQKLGAQLR